MKPEKIKSESGSEMTLDPENWEELKSLGKKMVVDMIGFLQNIGNQPVWRKPPPEVVEYFNAPLPVSPRPFGDVYADFRKNILPYYIGNIHPRFWGWVMGSGTAQGMLAEMLAAGMNCNVGIGDQAAMYADRQVVRWCCDMMGFPENSSGTLVNGASMANLNALLVARNAVNGKIRKKGIPGGHARLRMYASTETHSCVQKAAEIMGIGTEGLRKVRVNKDYQMDLRHLEDLIKEDRYAGHIPFCVVANAGTVNTGAIDPLDEIFLVALKYKLWFHVDGAFGALIKLLPEFDGISRAISLADSVAFDLHKWMSVPYEAGVVLVRDAQAHRDTFALQPDYIANQERGVAGGPEQGFNFGIDLSRGFKALKIWMGIQEQGIEKYKDIIRQNILQASYLGLKVKQSKKLELMAPVSTNVVCFRYNPGELPISILNRINQEILMRLQETGVATPSSTKLEDAYCLRAAICNHRSREEDFDVLVQETCRLGDILVSELVRSFNGKTQDMPGLRAGAA
ncbi:MAG: pyridoxal phosphate-dependent decarboxylase family protein [Chitinophagaceae bacterium]